MAKCEHLKQVNPSAQPSADGCEECLKTGQRWVQLRESAVTLCALSEATGSGVTYTRPTSESGFRGGDLQTAPDLFALRFSLKA